MTFLNRISASMARQDQQLPQPQVRQRIFPDDPPMQTPVEEAAPDPEPLRRPQRRFIEPVAEPFGPRYLTNMLTRQDVIQDTSRVGTQFVHVSSLQDFCDRSYVLADQEGKLFGDKPTGGHRVMWKIGRAVEKHVRDSIIKDREYQGIIGRWTCACEGSVREGRCDLDLRCDQCGTELTNYKELVLRDQEAGIVGSPDIVMEVEGRILPVEIKSMNAKDWEKLEAPKPDHLFQVLSYRKLLHTAGFQLLPVNAVITVTKDFRWGSPYKEFHIQPTRALGAIVEAAWDDAKRLKEARDAKRVPPRVKCKAITDTRAKACPVSATCFMRRE
jgi:hypothetical protein